MRHHLTNNAYTSNEEIMVEKCEKSSFPFEAVHPHINICILLMKGMLIRALSLDFVIWLSKELHKYLLWTKPALSYVTPTQGMSLLFQL